MTTTSTRTSTITFLALILLFVATGFLARSYRAERQSRAEHHFELGQQLDQKGNKSAALAQYRAALSIEPVDTRYELALTLVLVDLGRLQEAQSHLEELLAQDPTNGQLNLIMARIVAAEGDSDSAITFYHRAIYGLWPDQPLQQRVKVRFELVDYLAKNGLRQELLPSLVQLESDLPENPDMKLRVAGMFAEANDPRPAADLYREVIKAQPRDGSAWAGLGEAQFAMRDYATAQTALRRAATLHAGGTVVKAHLGWVNEYLSLDPTQERLTDAERYKRAQRLLGLTLSALDECLSASSGDVPDTVARMADHANDLLSTQAKLADREQATNDAVSTAEQLWTVRQSTCPAAAGPAGHETPLAALMAQLAQSQSPAGA